MLHFFVFLQRMNIPNKTLEDLEFNKVLTEVEKFAKTERVKKTILKLKPIENKNSAQNRLQATNEYLSSLQGNNRFPFSEYDDILNDLKKLDVENIQLPASVFLAIKSQALQIKELKNFIEEFEPYFPVFYKKLEKIPFEPEIVKIIDTVFDKHGEIKDNASPELKSIRKEIKQVSKQISERFNGALKAYIEYLDDIRESILEDRRVLAVKSMYRKKVPGRLMGTSKTGSISFIEPNAVLQTQRELEELKEDEKNEIRKILRELTQQIAEYQSTLFTYQNFLFQLDLISAQAQYAEEINACLPKINQHRELHLIDAYHPILYLQHKREKRQIYPQTLDLNDENRILVISGPNAGGKSITLKTVGLLQIMIQSGLLIPVHPKSSVFFFENIFTDIGDNQSIENQLSTYSYRLKQMQYFLYNTNEDTLLLIDEFGTGSDPELGGALAEVFLEEFYEMQAFGVFTTHYTNLKILVENLDAATNASMLFNEKNLEPMYTLEVGQAGSSFTFEVAQKNKIPFRLINRAKKKTERNKVRLDKTILKLQQEKFDVQKTKNELKDLKEQSQEQKQELENKQEKIESKLYDFQRLYEQENKYIQIGKKVEEMADIYLKNKNKKKLVGNFLKLVETENAKKQPNHFKEKHKQKQTTHKVKKELSQNAEKLEERKEKVEAKKKEETQKRIENLKVGDRVKINGSSSSGTVEKIEGDKVIINYGKFRTQISIFEVHKI